MNLESFIRLKALENTAYDNDKDFNPYDASGGNFDDAYALGCDDGAIEFARELLNKYFS